MNQVIKFPDLRPPSRGGPIRELPPLAQYRQSTPAIITAGLAAGKPRMERKRLWMWFGLAVALHATLLVAIWLTPPLRLKWSPSPDAWVQVVSLPKPAPPPAPAVTPPPHRATGKTGGPKAPAPGQPLSQKAR